MYYYIVGKNDLYLSSTPESLVAIGGKPGVDLFELDENTVYKITNGNIASAEKFVLSRTNAIKELITIIIVALIHQLLLIINFLLMKV
jgi:hypothetical protein